MTIEKVQLVGKVTGLDYELTLKKFDKYDKMLSKLGYIVTDPMKIVPKDTPWDIAMEITLLELEDQDAVFLLPDWTKSDGSKEEVKKAIEKKLEILSFYDYEKIV